MPEARLAASYQHCHSLTQRAARNFYYALRLLPAAKRDAICALYAFMRIADDLSDELGTLEIKKHALAEYHRALDRALAGDYGESRSLPALHDTVQRYSIPPQYLHDLIAGTELDLTSTRYATFEDLRKYCHHVAGTVGLCCIQVFGYGDPGAPVLAEKLGLAFQLTNILRDVGGDLELDRIYIPHEDIERFFAQGAFERRHVTAAFGELMKFEAARARDAYRQGAGLIALVSEDSRAALWALIRIYSRLLRRIEQRGYNVFAGRVGLSTAQKVGVMLRARLGMWSATNAV